jgi:hypothetical protein
MVPYIRAAEIERRTRALWLTHGLAPRFDVERLLDDLDLGLLWLPLEANDGLTVAAELVPDIRKVWVNEDLVPLFESNPPLLRFTLAHEIGHWFLHSELIESGSLSERRAGPGVLACRQSDLETPIGRGDGYRVEFQANLFASHLLAPDSILVNQIERHGCDGWAAVRRLASAFALSPTAALVRLIQDGHAHRDHEGVPRPGRVVPDEQTSLGL